jgi:two-component system chemotaxis response regulator CheB
MGKKNIIVIGASTGGVDAIKKLTADIPVDFDASIFIVWHMAPSLKGVLPHILNKQGKNFAANAVDQEEIKPGRIYIAPPDHHLLLEEGKIRVTRGPKENRFRPAVDPLFRSAAYTYGPRVIGIILSGGLDDGTAGLWLIKEKGGIAIVQDPSEAEVSSMPESAMREVNVDYCVSVTAMAPLLIKLIKEECPEKDETTMEGNSDIEKEIQIQMPHQEDPADILAIGELSPYTCPECHGVLSAIKEGNRVRYRCHTGHAFSADTLLAMLTENIEESLWTAIRSIQESTMMLSQLGDHFAQINKPEVAARYFQKAKEAEERANKVREVVSLHEQLSKESIQQEAM